MDPNRPRKDQRPSKTKAKTPRRVEARSIFSSQPCATVGLGQPGFGIISNLNDTMRRHQGEAPGSGSAPIRMIGMNRILGVAQQETFSNCNSSPQSSGPQTAPSLVSSNSDMIYENSPSSYQMASISIPTPSISGVTVAAATLQTDLNVNRFIGDRGAGASGTIRGFEEYGVGSGSDLTNYGFSLDDRSMTLSPDIVDYSRQYVPNMNETTNEQLQPTSSVSDQYDLQQENWFFPERDPAGAFEMLHRYSNPQFPVRQSGEGIISQGTQGQHLHSPYPANPPIVPREAQDQNLLLLPMIPAQAQTYEDPGVSYAPNGDPRQYLNQGGSHSQSEIQHLQSMINNQHISHEEVLNACLGEVLPPSQLISSNDDRTQQQYQSQPIRSVIMHTNNVVQHSNQEMLTEPPAPSSFPVHEDGNRSPNKKKSVPRKPRKPVEVEKQNESLAELFMSVIDKAVCNKSLPIENSGSESVRISNVHGVDQFQGNTNVEIKEEVSNTQLTLNSSNLDGLASRVSLFSELPTNPESVYRGGDLFIMKTCHEGHPLPPVGAAIVGTSALVQTPLEVAESTPLTKKPRKKAEPKPKATTPRKARVTKAKAKETDSTNRTSEKKGQGSKTVVKKELDQVQMEEVMFSAVGTVLGKDAAKSCEEELVKVPKLEETVTDRISAADKLVSKFPDLTVSLRTMTEAELAAFTTSSRTTATVTSVKSEPPDEDSDASSIAENNLGNNLLVKQEIESEDEEYEENKSKRYGRGKRSTSNSGKSTNRNRSRRRVSLDVTSDSGDDEDYTPRTTRSRSAKVKSVSSSGRSATGADSDSRSSTGHRWKDSVEYGEAEGTDLDSETGTIKEVVGEHGDNSAAQDARTIKQEDEMVQSSSARYQPLKTVSAKRGRKITAGGVRKLGRPKQFRLKKGRESKENRGIFRDDEMYPECQITSQDCFVDENLVIRKHKRGKNKKKVVDTLVNFEDQDDEKQDKYFHYRRPNYTEEETKRLYGHERFVIDVKDIDKDPSNIHIWQIIEPLSCLRRYSPCKFGQQQYFKSSQQRWFFTEDEFRNEEFYDRFQPIVVNVALPEPRFSGVFEMVDYTVHYPYIDKSFFNRMVKSIGKIHSTEFLRKEISVAVPLMLYKNLDPSSLTNLFNAASDPRQILPPGLVDTIRGWNTIGNFIEATLNNAASGKCDFNPETLLLLRTFPKMRYSSKTANKEVYCTACSPKFQRIPMVKVVFNTKLGFGTSYDPVTLREHPIPQKPRNDAEHWCRSCSLAAKKYHRLAHFRYSFGRIMRHNMARDVQICRDNGVIITDHSLLLISDFDVNWRYTQFLDLQLCIAEVVEEFYQQDHPQS